MKKIITIDEFRDMVRAMVNEYYGDNIPDTEVPENRDAISVVWGKMAAKLRETYTVEGWE